MTSPHPPTDAPRVRHRARTIVLSGPSGAGKTTIAARLLRDPRFARARTATTRPPRDGEVDGEDYDFLTEGAFGAALARGAFLEHAEVYGHLYGTPRAHVEEVLAAGRHCVVVVDVQGAESLRRLGLEAYYVFVRAPSLDELRRRLESRGKDAPEDIERRVDAARDELGRTGPFDMVLVNDDVEAATRRLVQQAAVEWSPAEE